MRLKKFKQTTSNLFAENRLIRFIAIMMLIATLMNFVQLRMAMNSEKTHVITQCSSQYWFTTSDADDQYFMDLSETLVGWLGTSTAGTVEENSKMVLRLAHPKHLTEISDNLKAWIQVVKNNPRHTYSFVGTDKKINRKTKELLVEGVRSRILDGHVKEKTRILYTFKYTIEAGRFWLTAVGMEKTR
jgi:conjugal transfer pilus assembly protein TraE